MEQRLKRTYKFNASHSNLGQNDTLHSHTFMVTLCFDFCSDATEAELHGATEDFLDGFRGCNLNTLPFFEDAYPSIEEIGERFYFSLKDIFARRGGNLYELGVADNPMVSYIISDRILLPNLNDNISGKNYSMLIKMFERIE